MTRRPMPALEAVDPSDLSELGDRAAMGLWGENTGLPWGQRLPAIAQRKPPGLTWRIHYEGRVPVRMTWGAWNGVGMW